MPQETEGQAPLSVHRAFVVHFRTNSNVTHGRVAGRVEHVASGQVVHFASLEELLAFMGRVLATVRPRHAGNYEAVGKAAMSTLFLSMYGNSCVTHAPAPPRLWIPVFTGMTSCPRRRASRAGEAGGTTRTLMGNLLYRALSSTENTFCH